MVYTTYQEYFEEADELDERILEAEEKLSKDEKNDEMLADVKQSLEKFKNKITGYEENGDSLEGETSENVEESWNDLKRKVEDLID